MLQVLRNDVIFTAIMDLRDSEFHLFHGKPPNTDVFFSSHHTVLGIPIGIAKQGAELTIIPANMLVPCLCITEAGIPTIVRPNSKWYRPEKFKVIVQCGPTLIKNRQEKYEPAIEQLKPPKSDFVAAGITKYGKLLLAYSEKDILGVVKSLLENGCINAMLLPSDNKSLLKVGNYSMGKAKRVGLGVSINGLDKS